MTGTIANTLISSTYAPAYANTTLLSTGTIDVAGSGNGIYGAPAGRSFTNSGLVVSGKGIVLSAAASVTNLAGGRISGTYGAIAQSDVAGGLTNYGTISSSQGYGVDFAQGGLVSNFAHGVITAYNTGVVIANAAGTLDNAGLITSTGSYATAVYVGEGGTVTNTGAISGTYDSVVFRGPVGISLLTNSGTITDTSTAGAAVSFYSGGTLVNLSGGLIIGGAYAAYTDYGASTVVNAGTLAAANASADALSMSDGAANRLVVDPGAVFVGVVDGGNPVVTGAVTSTLELAGAGPGLLAGLGSQIVDFGAIVFDPGADWTVSGTLAGLSGTITGFAPGDTLDVTGLAATGLADVGNQVTLDTAGAPAVLDLSGNFAGEHLVYATAAGNTDISLACFAAGSRILTAAGEMAVERLRAGDRVVDLLAGRLVPVRWIGHRAVEVARHAEPAAAQPVRVAAGAFGPGRPHRDLDLSRDHAVWVDGVLVPIWLLVNGSSIRPRSVARVTWFHVELDRHGVLLAEGLPAESYLDTGNRAAFANAPGATAMTPDFALAAWDAKSCAPLVLGGPTLERLRDRLGGLVVDSKNQGSSFSEEKEAKRLLSI
jgi:hypothetical protein